MNQEDLPAGLSLVEEPMPGIKVDTDLCKATVLFHGAHLIDWQPNSTEHPVLWMSQKSAFADDEPIRGGVPVVYPWFGAGRNGDEDPGHGFARLANWSLASATITDRGAARIVLRLLDTDGLPGTDRYPKANVELHLAIGLLLQESLVVTAGEQEISFECGFHTYYSVSDINNVAINGLEDQVFIDRLDNDAKHTQEGDVTFNAETDVIYSTTDNVRIRDTGWNREIQIEKVGSRDTVVWNPWIDKSARMPDFGDDEWKEMVCVEPMNRGGNAVWLQPGERFMISQNISVRPL